MLTSRRPSADHKSTLRTNKLCSISLEYFRFKSGTDFRQDNYYLGSISAPVIGSVIIIRIAGGGVIGRRSCKGDMSNSLIIKVFLNPYLVTKSTHPSTLWLLHYIKPNMAS
jgi:hypothetical protein